MRNAGLSALALAGTVLIAIALVWVMRRASRYFRGGRKLFAEKNRLVVIHADWRGHCKDLLAEGGAWDQVKAGLPGVGVDEILESSNASLVQTLGVTAFPDIRMMKGNVGLAKFEGDRTAQQIIQFALKHTRD